MTQTLEELTPILKTQIVECLNLDSMIARELDYDTPLFGDHTGLDSIDALELVVLLDKKYGIKLTDSKVARKIFVNVRSIAEFVHSKRKP
jgi:acyl carrier protein